LPKLTEASKAKKNDSKFSTMTMPKTMPVQNFLRYISFKTMTGKNKIQNQSLSSSRKFHTLLKIFANFIIRFYYRAIKENFEIGKK
jgi:zona occludens toxin (predicted ATPase)